MEKHKRPEAEKGESQKDVGLRDRHEGIFFLKKNILQLTLSLTKSYKQLTKGDDEQTMEIRIGNRILK